MDAFISAWNENAEPFVWTKKKVRQRRFKGGVLKNVPAVVTIAQDQCRLR
jgi:hypothetical protein